MPSPFQNDLKMVPYVPNDMLYLKVQELLEKNDFPLVIQNGTNALEILRGKYSPKCLKQFPKTLKKYHGVLQGTLYHNTQEIPPKPFFPCVMEFPTLKANSNSTLIAYLKQFDGTFGFRVPFGAHSTIFKSF